MIDELGFDSWQGERMFFFVSVFVRKFKPSLGPSQNLIEGGTEGHSCGVKRLWREAEYSSPPAVDVNN